MKLLLCAAMLAALAAMAPAHADPSSCTAIGSVNTLGTESCQYVATGTGTYTEATLSDWWITTERGGHTVVLAVPGGILPSPVNRPFDIPSVAGETITVQFKYAGPEAVGVLSAGN